ncbi:hypothetical protein Tco_1122411 [Tanacetum coccineum]|uniref:Uncharacterized protein n=1 Tax=Tanacetum coccineum TaxID=301880 RepID=A0ABQ5J0F7_9ASTR
MGDAYTAGGHMRVEGVQWVICPCVHNATFTTEGLWVPRCNKCKRDSDIWLVTVGVPVMGVQGLFKRRTALSCKMGKHGNQRGGILMGSCMGFWGGQFGINENRTLTLLRVLLPSSHVHGYAFIFLFDKGCPLGWRNSKIDLMPGAAPVSTRNRIRIGLLRICKDLRIVRATASTSRQGLFKTQFITLGSSGVLFVQKEGWIILVLLSPHGAEELHCYCDASHKGFGAVLMQTEVVGFSKNLEKLLWQKPNDRYSLYLMHIYANYENTALYGEKAGMLVHKGGRVSYEHGIPLLSIISGRAGREANPPAGGCRRARFLDEIQTLSMTWNVIE